MRYSSVFLVLAVLAGVPQSWCQVNDLEISNGIVLEQITEPVVHAEGPHWLEEEQALYYVDITGQGFHRYEPYTRKHTSITLNNIVGVAIPIEGAKGKFVIGYGTNVSVLSWDGNSQQYSIENKYQVDTDKVGNKFNDGKADSKGRVWIGTMGEEKPVGKNLKKYQASLYKVSMTCELTKEVSPVSISNGIAWSKDNTKMFYIDSPTRKIDLFDYNICNGKISNRRTFFDFDTYNITGVPDGMTIDSEDNLWIAVWGGGRVLEVSNEGKLKSWLQIPAERVTSVAWGGVDYDTLFVTTMKLGLTEKELEKQPKAGAVFKVVGLPNRGLPANFATSCLLHTPSLP